MLTFDQSIGTSCRIELYDIAIAQYSHQIAIKTQRGKETRNTNVGIKAWFLDCHNGLAVCVGRNTLAQDKG